MIHDPKLQLQDPITPNRLGKNRGGKEMSAPSISGHLKFAQKPTSSTPAASCSRSTRPSNWSACRSRTGHSGCRAHGVRTIHVHAGRIGLPVRQGKPMGLRLVRGNSPRPLDLARPHGPRGILLSWLHPGSSTISPLIRRLCSAMSILPPLSSTTQAPGSSISPAFRAAIPTAPEPSTICRSCQ